MKYAFSSYSAPDRTLAELFTLARRYGYDGVEPRIDKGHRHGVEITTTQHERAAIRHQAIEAGTALCCLATSYAYSDPATAHANLTATLRVIDLAADVGAPLIKVFAGVLPPASSRASVTEQIGESLRTIAAYAEPRGVTVCVEVHDDWSNPLCMVDLLQRVDHRAVKVLWDVMHTLREGHATVDQAFRALQPWIEHVHIHDGLLRLDRLEFKPIGEGAFDHRRVVELLHAADYQGYLCGEWIDWEPAEIHLPRELATMRQYERDLNDCSTSDTSRPIRAC